MIDAAQIGYWVLLIACLAIAGYAATAVERHIDQARGDGPLPRWTWMAVVFTFIVVFVGCGAVVEWVILR